MVLRMSRLDVESEALHLRGEIRCIKRGAEVTACSTAGHGRGRRHDGDDAVARSLRQDNESLPLNLDHFISVLSNGEALQRCPMSMCLSKRCYIFMYDRKLYLSPNITHPMRLVITSSLQM